MSKLNMFQKDLIVLVSLLVFQMAFTFFTLRTTGSFENVEVSRTFLRLHFESAQGGFSFTPWLSIFYGLVLIALLLKKEKRLTIVYGLGLMILVQFNFLRTLYGLENQVVNHLSIHGRLSKEVMIDQSTVAHDISLYILLVMVLIKTMIVLYNPIKKILQKKFSKSPTPSDKAIHP